jgi:flagellar motility protein MotE (MotC chaperone)
MAQSTLQKLQKTKNSLSAYVGRNGRIHLKAQRGFKLVDRYTELKEKAIAEGVWAQFCTENGFSEEHTAYDYFA